MLIATTPHTCRRCPLLRFLVHLRCPSPLPIAHCPFLFLSRSYFASFSLVLIYSCIASLSGNNKFQLIIVSFFLKSFPFSIAQSRNLVVCSFWSRIFSNPYVYMHVYSIYSYFPSLLASNICIVFLLYDGSFHLVIDH